MGTINRLLTEKSNRTRQKFLSTFFVNTNKDHVEVNGFNLVRTWHGITGLPIIMLYTEESFASRNQYLAQQTLLDSSDGELNQGASPHREVPDRHEAR